MTSQLFTTAVAPTGIVPRAYQQRDFEESFRLWDAGTVGVLTRIFTGGGKTICACLKMRAWLDRGEDYRCMVLSYEQQLVWQFAEEIEDVLGITPGIEMGAATVDAADIPLITVATRQSLALHDLATGEQREELARYGLTDVGVLTKRAALSAIKALRAEADVQDVADGIRAHNESPLANLETMTYTRLNKFDNRLNWLVVFDEAHKYSAAHKTCGHVLEWFERNPASRRSGITATPKRSDKVSIGTRLFPGVAIDYPLRDAVRDGYAVPYVQRFITVEGVDFRRLKELAKGSQEAWDQQLDEILNTEEQLAKLCEPLLDMVGDRRTLIFSPSVAMAENVAAYLNARSECECSCGTKRWYPSQLIGDGAKCRSCGEWITAANVLRGGVVAQCVHGDIPTRIRRGIYAAHQRGEYQFLSVCSLCREGYNDRDISCVAVFRPVSKDAASLAEQMKGRGARPLRGLIEGLVTREERVAAIHGSAKPDCLIVDLVGVSGLEECASTIDIYADGLPDKVRERAEQYALTGGIPDVMEAIEQAKRDDDAEKEREREAAAKRREEAERVRREAAERRSRLDAEVKYSTHETGAVERTRDNALATEKQLKYISFCGLECVGWIPTKKQASRILGLFNQENNTPEQVAYKCGIKAEWWQRTKPSLAQQKLMLGLGIKGGSGMTPKQASQAIDRRKNAAKHSDNATLVDVARKAIDAARTHDELTAAAQRIKGTRGEFTAKDWALVCEYGNVARQRLNDF